jgi:uncharacterized protein Yka (UPF0111/DUF47 family)
VTTKTRVVAELGETGLVAPQLVATALAANDRAKYYMSLLQQCRQHAIHPEHACSDLRDERIASGESDTSFDEIVAASRLDDDGSIVVPRLAHIEDRLLHSIGEMIAPVSWADTELGRPPESYERRLLALRARLLRRGDTTIHADYVDAVTQADRDGPDSLHILVMDLHRELNTIQAQLAEEIVDGAQVYGLAACDKHLVRAFMRGVNATAPLKFDHPGLGTTATRTRDQLVIQNDVGTTDAHVLVVHVVGFELSMIYTDVHSTRLEFFKGLLTPGGVEWSAAEASGSHEYVTCVGRRTCDDVAELESLLETIGSRLVFLIDWNRARKRLARFVGKADAVAVLQWAADQNVGHRAFLEAGGERLVYRVLERAAPPQIRYGARLDEVIGRQAAVSFLQAVLRVTSDAWRGQRSLRFVRDEIQAELLDRLQESQQGVLALAADHAALIAGLATLAHDAALRAGGAADTDGVTSIARGAKRWETKADDIVSRGRELQRHAADDVDSLLVDADDVADGLEEVVFLFTLLNRSADTARAVVAIPPISRLAVESAYEYVKCVEGARHLRRGGTREDMHAFLVAVERLTNLEHESDEAERRAEAAILDSAADFQSLHVLTRIAAGLEESIDRLARCALALKDSVLKDMLV